MSRIVQIMPAPTGLLVNADFRDGKFSKPFHAIALALVEDDGDTWVDAVILADGIELADDLTPVAKITYVLIDSPTSGPT